MANKLKLDGVEYSLDGISPETDKWLKMYQFAHRRLYEAEGLRAVLQKAKLAYSDEIKKEIFCKAGLNFDG